MKEEIKVLGENIKAQVFACVKRVVFVLIRRTSHLKICDLAVESGMSQPSTTTKPSTVSTR